MDHDGEDGAAGRDAGARPRKEYLPPTLLRIEVGRTATGENPKFTESAPLDYCMTS